MEHTITTTKLLRDRVGIALGNSWMSPMDFVVSKVYSMLIYEWSFCIYSLKLNFWNGNCLGFMGSSAQRCFKD